MPMTGAAARPVTDCIVERRSNITPAEAEKKIKRLMKDAAFCSSLSTDVSSQLASIRKSFKDLEKFGSSQ